MNKKRIIVLGNLPLATKIIEFLETVVSVDIVGVVHPGKNVKYPSSDGGVSASEYCEFHKIQCLSIDDVKMLDDLDLAISARNNTILKKDFINKFKLGILNCHGGYLPEYKGVGGHIFPIINCESYTGATIHWMNELVDDGSIIDRKKIEIMANDTGLSLFNKINDELYNLIVKHFKKVLSGRVIGKPQSEFDLKNKKSYFYYKKDISKMIDSKLRDENMRRALTWPNKINNN
jgi:methionyl-tRNA formyltransferase